MCLCKLFKKRKENKVLETEIKEMVLQQEFHSVKAKVREFDVPEDEPFANDKLDRKPQVEVLTNAISVYQDGAVIALNGVWGSGKTTFVRMWMQHLENNGFPAIYYNAWENDINEEPLFSMVKSLRSLTQDESVYDGFVENAGKFIVGALFGAVKGVSGIWGDVVSGAIKGGVENLEKDCIDSLKSKEDISTLMHGFREALIDYLSSCKKKIPLVYFIDELDRCNPAFAVKVLERIKHLFEIPNVVFILSIDKQQLAYSINGFYGSESINSMEYLRRFIDIDYNLPEPEPEKYCEYLYDFYNFADFTESETRKKITSSRSIDDKGDLLSIAKLLIKHKHLNLRQAERIFALARIALCEMSTNSKLFADVYFLMTYLKVCEPDVFENINGINYRLQELVNAFETLANDELIKDDRRRHNDFIIAVCHLLNCYAESIKNKYRQGDDRFETIYDEQSNDHHPNIAFNKFDNETCFTLLKHYNERQIDLVCEIEHFTKKLALTEPFRVGEII